VRSGDRVLWQGEASLGYTTTLVPAGPNVASTVPFVVTVGGATRFSGAVACDVVRSRTLHLLPHSHVDIGYSDPQPVVETKQIENVRRALALIERFSAYPPEARFRWNVEVLWPVERFLAEATPAERGPVSHMKPNSSPN
jgi:hypothetical protein